MKQKINLVAIVIAIFLIYSCNNANSNMDKEKDSVAKVKKPEQEQNNKDCKGVHWSHHKGEDGPENWKYLCDNFADCGGNSQSPIDIITQTVIRDGDLKALKFSYGKSKVNIINNSHTVQFNVDGENIVNINNKDYKLIQFHYHSLSEHTINGKHYPLEAHFVHKHSETDFAVLAVMFVEGKENEFLKKYLDQFPTKKGNYKTDEMIDLLKLIPENKSYFYYSGSLTTPPCTEVVSWYVLKNPVEASKEQIVKFSKILDNNYRPVQSLNGRKVKLYDN